MVQLKNQRNDRRKEENIKVSGGRGGHTRRLTRNAMGVGSTVGRKVRRDVGR